MGMQYKSTGYEQIRFNLCSTPCLMEADNVNRQQLFLLVCRPDAAFRGD